MSEPTLFIGGTGTAGSRVGRLLAERNILVAVGTRRPSKDHQVRLDRADPASVAAFEGIRAACLVAPTDRTDHPSLTQPTLGRRWCSAQGGACCSARLNAHPVAR